MPEITSLYTGLIAVLFAVLSTLAAMGRGRVNAPAGDGGDARLALELRRFGNLAEYAAMALLVLLLLELTGHAARWLHGYGATLVALRLLHPAALFASPDAPLWRKVARFVAAAGTAGLIAAGGVALIL